jgi:hypothetical protein
MVIQDNLESLWNFLQLIYYHQSMIPYVNKPTIAIIQICPEDKQNLTADL